MDNFEDEFESPPVDVDPAAEFLAKEQEELGDIGEDLGLAPPQEIAAFKEDNDFENIGDDMQSQIPVSTGFGFKEEDIGGENPFSGGEGVFGHQNISDVNVGMSNLTVAKEEPEFLKKWKLEQEDRLKKKDADEEIMKEQLREQARQELEDWYKRYETQLEKTKSVNREAESDFVAEVGGMNHIEPGSEWERVSKHCDFSAKAPGHTKDVSRMRTILLQLKQAPPTKA